MKQRTWHEKPINKPTVVLSPKNLAFGLTAAVLCIILAHVSSGFLKYVLHHDTQLGLHRLFDLNTENNIPTWFSSLALLLCAALLAGISVHKRQVGDHYANHWVGLTTIFLFMSADEAASIHEMATPLLQFAFTFDSYLLDSWVILYGMVVLIIGLVYLQFLASLPPRTRYQFLMAGILYVGGALGVEMLGANAYAMYGKESLIFWNFYTLEESLEMFGIVVFVYGLSSYMGAHIKEVKFQIVERPSIRHTALGTELKSLPSADLPAA